MLAYLSTAKADMVYLDLPFASTKSYEKAFALVDEFIGATPLPLSSFSSSHPPLDELDDACRHIRVLILSLGNARLN